MQSIHGIDSDMIKMQIDSINGDMLEMWNVCEISHNKMTYVDVSVSCLIERYHDVVFISQLDIIGAYIWINRYLLIKCLVVMCLDMRYYVTGYLILMSSSWVDNYQISHSQISIYE